MRKIFMAVVALVSAAMVVSCGGNGTTVKKGNVAKIDSLSYCLGANIGGSIKQQLADVPFNLEAVKKGMTDAFTNKATQSHEESIATLQSFFSTVYPERREAIASHTEGSPVITMFDTDEECETISYAFGHDIGTNVGNSKLPIEYYWLIKGFQDAHEGATELTQEDVMAFLQNYFTVVMPAKAAERSAEWLAKKEKAFGVKKTESGLLYKVVKAGDLSKAATNDEDVVKVHYVGKLQDGTIFDASRFAARSKEQQEMIREQRPDMFDEKGNLKEEEQPIQFPLNRVIAGWTEGMKLVGPGGKIMLYIPAELAYGQRGAGRDIGPNEALEFEVELIEVIPVTAEETAAPAEIVAE
jgi:FKBP-type peptidyl-prolyl cis-trans isomerase FkpA